MKVIVDITDWVNVPDPALAPSFQEVGTLTFHPAVLAGVYHGDCDAHWKLELDNGQGDRVFPLHRRDVEVYKLADTTDLIGDDAPDDPDPVLVLRGDKVLINRLPEHLGGPRKESK